MAYSIGLKDPVTGRSKPLGEDKLTDEQKAAATRYVTKRCEDSALLLEMLGLTEESADDSD